MNRSAIVVILVVIVAIGGGVLLTRADPSSSVPQSPTPTSQAMKAVQSSLTKDEETQILAASNTLVTANTEAGYKYSLAIKKQVGEYVRVDVTPGEGEMIDPAQVILQKKDGTWEAITFGTSFPDLYDQVPELFQ